MASPPSLTVTLPTLKVGPGSAKSITRSLLVALVTEPALPPVKLLLAKVTVRLAMSLALACAVALPVKLKVAVVALVFTSTAVIPAGTLVTVPKAAPLTPVNVSLLRVMVLTVVLVPSLAAASTKLVAL